MTTENVRTEPEGIQTEAHASLTGLDDLNQALLQGREWREHGGAGALGTRENSTYGVTEERNIP